MPSLLSVFVLVILLVEDSSEGKLGFFDQFHVVLARMVVLKDVGHRRGIPTQENSLDKGVQTVVVLLKMGVT